MTVPHPNLMASPSGSRGQGGNQRLPAEAILRWVSRVIGSGFGQSHRYLSWVTLQTFPWTVWVPAWANVIAIASALVHADPDPGFNTRHYGINSPPPPPIPYKTRSFAYARYLICIRYQLACIKYHPSCFHKLWKQKVKHATLEVIIDHSNDLRSLLIRMQLLQSSYNDLIRREPIRTFHLYICTKHHAEY